MNDSKHYISRQAADDILEVWGEDYIFYVEKYGFVLTWDDAKEYINSLVEVPHTEYLSGTDYTDKLEQKLIDTECGECTKNMLECKCDDKEE